MTSTHPSIDDRLVETLAAGASATEAAAALGLSVSTVYRRLREPSFRHRVFDTKAQHWRAAAREFRSEVGASLRKLVELRDSETVPPSTAQRAAVSIVELAVQLHKLVEHEVRLSALEALADQMTPAGALLVGNETSTEDEK